MPRTCACGKICKMAHDVQCLKCDYMQIIHNDIQKLFDNMLNEVCDDVELEPCIQMLKGETLANRSNTTDDEI